MNEMEGRWFIIRDSIAPDNTAEENDKFREELKKLEDQDSRGIDAALADVGLPRIKELNISSDNAKIALPIILEWLPRLQISYVKRIVTGCLQTKLLPKSATTQLLDLFEQADPTSFGDYKWSLGFAVSFAPDPNCYDRIIQLITDKSQGSARSGLVRALARFEHPDRNKVLCDLLNEEWSIAVVAVEVIGILKLIEYRKLIVPFTTHSEQYVRQKTKAALAKLDKFEAK